MPVAKTKKFNQIKNKEKEIEKSQNGLDEADAYIKDSLAFLPLSICDISPTGMIENINKSFEELSGFTKAEAVGKYLLDFFLEKDKIKKLLNYDTAGDPITGIKWQLFRTKNFHIIKP